MTTAFRLAHPTAITACEGIPGPEPSLPLGNAADFLGRWPWEVCAEYGRKYGGMSVAWLMGTPAIVLNDPDLIGAVLDSDSASYYKDAPHDAVAPVISDGDLFIANGPRWAELRRVSPLNRTFTPSWLAAQVPVVRQVVLNAVNNLVDQPTDDLIEPLRRIVYDAISAAVWGEALGEVNYHDFMKMARVGNFRLTEPPILQKLPPLDPLFYIDRARWAETFRGRVAAARSRPTPGGGQSLLELALQAGPEMPDDELAHALSAPVYFGGVFSTAAGIAHTLRFLTADAIAMNAVLEELRHHNPLATTFDAAGLAACERLDHAVRESLRLSPPVTLFFRNVLRERSAVLGGRTLPPNTLIFITNWLLHRDPSRWMEPDRYSPDRWAAGGVERDPLGSGYFFPFGRGPRACVGQSFALFLIKMTLAVILTRVRASLDLSNGDACDFFFAVQHPRRLAARFEPASVC